MTCGATDMPQITSIYSANPTAKISTILVDEEDNIVTEKTTRSTDLVIMRITPHDPHEIEIGDRIRVSTRDPSSTLNAAYRETAFMRDISNAHRRKDILRDDKRSK